MEVAKNVCGMRLLKREREEGSLNSGVRKLASWMKDERKEECFLMWRRTRNEEELEKYRRMKRVAKVILQEDKKKRIIEEWKVIAENVNENKTKRRRG